MARTGSRSAVGPFWSKRLLQLWGRLGGRGVPEGRGSLGKGWMWRLRRSRTGTREYSPCPTARCKFSLLDPSLKDWKGGGLWGSQDPRNEAGNFLMCLFLLPVNWRFP